MWCLSGYDLGSFCYFSCGVVSDRLDFAVLYCCCLCGLLRR